MEKTMTVNQTEYTIVKLLGHGKGGYSYLACRDGEQVVLKQIHHEPCAYYTFGNKIEAEQNDYQRLLLTGIRIPKLVDVDVPNERIVKEYIAGPTLSELIKQDMPIDPYLSQVREILIISRPILWYRRNWSTTWTMNATPIRRSGALRTGE